MSQMKACMVLFTAGALTGAAECSAAMVDMDKGRQMFLQSTTPACAVCHTLEHAGSTGTIGPNLDELKPTAERVAKAVREGLGVMPQFENLSADEVRLLSDYVESATK